jgi:hypothetical protein
MHWTDRRRATANVGKELRARGWNLYGWKDDKSDSMTDYWDPESWSGIADHPDHPGVVVVVGGWSAHDSGREQYRHVREPGEMCPHCDGSGDDPSGWTLAAARADPRRFNREHLILEHGEESGMRALFPDVVSPLHFNERGRLRCVKCAGQGHKITVRQELVCTWPTFQGNPKRKTWHVERDGQIVKSGTGLAACANWNYDDEQRAAVTRMCDRIERVIMPRKPSPDVETTTTSDGIQLERDRDWLWVYFPAKPDEAIRAGLKRLRGRWSRKRKGWYFKNGDAVQAQVEELLGLTPMAAAEPPPPIVETISTPPPAVETPAVDLDNVQIEEVSEDVYIIAKCAKLNKRDTLREYRELVKSRDYRDIEYKITHRVTLTPEQWDAFTVTLMDDRPWLAGEGGTNTHAELREVESLWEYTEEEREQYKAESFCYALEISAPGRETIYVDPQGHNYARYVALDGIPKPYTAPSTPDTLETPVEPLPAFAVAAPLQMALF